MNGFPTFVLVEADGKEIDRISGYAESADFIKQLKEFQGGKNFQSLQKEVSNSPNDPQLHWKLASKYRERGDREKTAEHLNKILELDFETKTESAILAKRELAIMALEDSGDTSKLLSFAKKYPDPKFALPAHEMIAAFLGQKDQPDIAEPSFDYVIKNKPDDAQWLNDYAWFLATHDRKLDRALEYAKKAVAKEPKSAGILDTLAECYFRLKQYDKAIETQKKAVELADSKTLKEELQDRLKKFEAAR